MTEEDEIKAKTRVMRLELLAPFLDEIRSGTAEERRRGMSEAEIQRRISLFCDEVEKEKRGTVADNIVDEMKLLRKPPCLRSTGRRAFNAPSPQTSAVRREADGGLLTRKGLPPATKRLTPHVFQSPRPD